MIIFDRLYIDRLGIHPTRAVVLDAAKLVKALRRNIASSGPSIILQNMERPTAKKVKYKTKIDWTYSNESLSLSSSSSKLAYHSPKTSMQQRRRKNQRQRKTQKCKTVEILYIDHKRPWSQGTDCAEEVTGNDVSHHEVENVSETTNDPLNFHKSETCDIQQKNVYSMANGHNDGQQNIKRIQQIQNVSVAESSRSILFIDSSVAEYSDCEDVENEDKDDIYEEIDKFVFPGDDGDDYGDDDIDAMSRTSENDSLVSDASKKNTISFASHTLQNQFRQAESPSNLLSTLKCHKQEKNAGIHVTSTAIEAKKSKKKKKTKMKMVEKHNVTNVNVMGDSNYDEQANCKCDDTDSPNIFHQVGDSVFAQYMGGNVWFPAVILAVSVVVLMFVQHFVYALIFKLRLYF